MTQREKNKARMAFTAKAYAAANKLNRAQGNTANQLFQAGELGVVLLQWMGHYWEATWFDGVKGIENE